MYWCVELDFRQECVEYREGQTNLKSHADPLPSSLRLHQQIKHQCPAPHDEHKTIGGLHCTKHAKKTTVRGVALQLEGKTNNNKSTTQAQQYMPSEAEPKGAIGKDVSSSEVSTNMGALFGLAIGVARHISARQNPGSSNQHLVPDTGGEFLRPPFAEDDVLNSSASSTSSVHGKHAARQRAD